MLNETEHEIKFQMKNHSLICNKIQIKYNNPLCKYIKINQKIKGLKCVTKGKC